MDEAEGHSSRSSHTSCVYMVCMYSSTALSAACLPARGSVEEAAPASPTCDLGESVGSGWYSPGSSNRSGSSPLLLASCSSQSTNLGVFPTPCSFMPKPGRGGGGARQSSVLFWNTQGMGRCLLSRRRTSPERRAHRLGLSGLKVPVGVDSLHNQGSFQKGYPKLNQILSIEEWQVSR